MKIAVKVMPRPDVLDIQGRAVESTLKGMGQKLSGVRVGRYVILDLPGDDEQASLRQAKEMAEKLLCNSLIETFELERLPSK